MLCDLVASTWLALSPHEKCSAITLIGEKTTWRVWELFAALALRDPLASASISLARISHMGPPNSRNALVLSTTRTSKLCALRIIRMYVGVCRWLSRLPDSSFGSGCDLMGGKIEPHVGLHTQ